MVVFLLAQRGKTARGGGYGSRSPPIFGKYYGERFALQHTCLSSLSSDGLFLTGRDSRL